MISMRIFIEEDGLRGKLERVEEIGWRGYVGVPRDSNLRLRPVRQDQLFYATAGAKFHGAGRHCWWRRWW